ncbi:MAG: hypothetical protein AAB719_01595 [Patescibacteria group bacterium]
MDGENNLNSGEKNGGAGPIIAVIIILALVILGALYFWGERNDRDELLNDDALEAIEMQSTSDETDSIEADLDATDVDSLDSEINAS